MRRKSNAFKYARLIRECGHEEAVEFLAQRIIDEKLVHREWLPIVDAQYFNSLSNLEIFKHTPTYQLGYCNDSKMFRYQTTNGQYRLYHEGFIIKNYSHLLDY